MASIKIKPIGIRDYYLNFKDVYARRIQVALIENDRLKEEIDRKRKELLPYVSMFKFPIIDYPEFQQNKYINGRLITAAIGLYSGVFYLLLLFEFICGYGYIIELFNVIYVLFG